MQFVTLVESIGRAGFSSVGSSLFAIPSRCRSCAWTWLRFTAGEPTVAAFYCTVEDPHVAVVELERADGGVQQVDAGGKRAAVFPYPWDMGTKWPAQQPRAIRLYDGDGQQLDLPTSLTAGEH